MGVVLSSETTNRSYPIEKTSSAMLIQMGKLMAENKVARAVSVATRLRYAPNADTGTLDADTLCSAAKTT